MSSTPFNLPTISRIDDLPARMAAALGAERTWHDERQEFSPELSYGRHAGPAPFSARHAAVIMLLFRRGGAWHLPLTQRPAALVNHGGQICLPGGTVDPHESSQQAAVRELGEELGFYEPIESLGTLRPCYVFASNFVVTPWVATADCDPRWQPNDREVERVVELPLEVLLDPACVGRVTVERGPVKFRAPCFWVGHDFIWGATSVMLGQLAGLLRSLCPSHY